MLLKEIKVIAEQKGVSAGKMRTKKDVIHAIQSVEGNQQCYGTNPSCNNTVCCWHGDCVKSVRTGKNLKKQQ